MRKPLRAAHGSTLEATDQPTLRETFESALSTANGTAFVSAHTVAFRATLGAADKVAFRTALTRAALEALLPTNYTTRE